MLKKESIAVIVPSIFLFIEEIISELFCQDENHNFDLEII